MKVNTHHLLSSYVCQAPQSALQLQFHQSIQKPYK